MFIIIIQLSNLFVCTYNLIAYDLNILTLRLLKYALYLVNLRDPF